ncbi:MAG: beta-glucosidase [Pseudonocardiales bacterium]|nr:beta-glucosidase [Pseudonocardiales bacterium]
MHRSHYRRTAIVTATAALVAGITTVLLPTAATAVVGPLPNVQNFEGDVPITNGNPGIFSFGADAAHTPTLSVVSAPNVAGEGADNHALDMPYDVTGYGGFTEDLAAAQDWSGYAGFSFWVKGTNSGQRIEYEIKDGGADGEHSELWQDFFMDTSSEWRQIQTPFSDFVRRTDYQPGGGPTDGNLDLSSMWGYAINVPANSQGELTVDDFAVYGTAAPKPPRVAASSGTYLVDAGETAHVAVTLTTSDGQPTTADASVAWQLDDGTAHAGTDYTDDSGTLEFPAGTASGTSKTIDVQTLANSTPSEATTLTVKLTPTGATLSGTSPLVVINAHGLAYLDSSRPVAQRVGDLMTRMNLADKVGQMTQAERAAVGNGSDITTYRLGSLLSGGGSTPTPNTPSAWADMIDGYQQRALSTPLQIPIIYGIDSVHGDNNLAGATLFPHNVGMGATRDPALAHQEGHIAATETRATGIPWAFSPCVCVTRDDRWGRAYESYSEDPALVEKMETVINGFQGNNHLARKTSVLATAKHFIGDGGTKYGTGSGDYPIDQGITYVTPQQLQKLFVGPYKTAIADHVGSVMPSYSSLQILGKDAAPIKMHARRDMITGLLKHKLGFQGFVISDYAAIDQIGPNYKNDVKVGINAGLDMIMVPNQYVTFENDLTDLVHSGDVSMARIDDAVRRILTAKFNLGLFDHPFANRSNIDTIGSAAHRAVARQAAAESQVLLKNAHHLLPLGRHAKVYVAGSNADDTGNQSGGWTLTWQGQSGTIPGATSILAGMQQDAPHAMITYSKDASAPTDGYDVGVVVVGEKPYAEGQGDIGNNGHTLQLSVADRNAVDRVCAAMRCAVLVVSGRPLDITGIVPESDAVVASWLPGSEGEGVADVLFGLRPFTGRLPVTWFKAESQIPINVGDANYDPLYPYGWGLQTGAQQDQRLPQSTLAALQRAAAALTQRAGWATRNRIVSDARAIAERVITTRKRMTATAPLTAAAEHALVAGHTLRAVKLLSRARAVAVAIRG